MKLDINSIDLKNASKETLIRVIEDYRCNKEMEELALVSLRHSELPYYIGSNIGMVVSSIDYVVQSKMASDFEKNNIHLVLIGPNEDETTYNSFSKKEYLRVIRKFINWCKYGYYTEVVDTPKL